ncbi:ATP-binding protein [[Clostridium] scindens]|uniref:ATP-binding protein n=1 Tax=Clostridium scindens (strain JCM 10418 / VPI 12708) TaxID=29347 RepID=UPI003992AC6F
MEITRGKIYGAKKTVIYGPEGIGKSTFASKFPDPVFIDTEGSTKDMDVARLPRPSSWNMLLEEIQYIKSNPRECRTLVIDTIDWAEQLCVEHICATHHKSGIEDFGYGNGYVYTKEEFGRFLNRLEDVVEAGVNVVLTAHAQIRKFEQPDEMGSYDRWELKLGKKTQSQTSPLVKEWADMLLFCNYKTYSIAVDKEGKKHKAQGGKRVMYTAHHPCWDAKNRYGLPEECEFDYSVIAGIIECVQGVQEKKEGDQHTASESAPVTNPAEKFRDIPETADEQVDFNTGEKIPKSEEAKKEPESKPPKEPADISKSETFRLNDYIPKALQDLMYPSLVSEDELMEAVYKRGFFPRGTPFQNLPQEFIEGCLIGAWPKVMGVINEIRSTYKIPFNE